MHGSDLAARGSTSQLYLAASHSSVFLEFLFSFSPFIKILSQSVNPLSKFWQLIGHLIFISTLPLLSYIHRSSLCRPRIFATVAGVMVKVLASQDCELETLEFGGWCWWWEIFGQGPFLSSLMWQSGVLQVISKVWYDWKFGKLFRSSFRTQASKDVFLFAGSDATLTEPRDSVSWPLFDDYQALTASDRVPCVSSLRESSKFSTTKSMTRNGAIVETSWR